MWIYGQCTTSYTISTATSNDRDDRKKNYNQQQQQQASHLSVGIAYVVSMCVSVFGHSLLLPMICPHSQFLCLSSLVSWRHCRGKAKIGELIQFPFESQTRICYAFSVFHPPDSVRKRRHHRRRRVKYANCTCTTSVKQSMSNYRNEFIYQCSNDTHSHPFHP